MKKFEERDFSIYRGKELKVTPAALCDEGDTAIVQDIEYDIGITIVSKEDPEDRLHCLTNPYTVKKKEFKDPLSKRGYKALFVAFLSEIVKGELNNYRIEGRMRRWSKRNLGKVYVPSDEDKLSVDHCAFSQ